MNAPSIAAADGPGRDTLERARSLARALRATSVTAPPLALNAATVELAWAEQLAPWLGAKIAAGKVEVPPSAADSLVREHQMCVASSVVREHVGASFVAQCRRAAIPVAWLKGMAMIPRVFRPGERSMIDVDALVPPSRWDEACQLAAHLPGVRPVILPSRAYTTAHDYVRAFTGPAGVTIEVHRFVCESSLFGIEYEGPDGLFGRGRADAAGLVALDEGDLFLTLAAHAAKHTFELPLRSFFDGLAMLGRGGLALDALAERAARWGMGTAFQLWMRTLHALAPWLVDAPCSQSLRWPWLAERLWTRTHDAVAWQRFVRLAWISDDPAKWARHVLTRIGLRVGDAIQG